MIDGMLKVNIYDSSKLFQTKYLRNSFQIEGNLEGFVFSRIEN